MKLGLQTISIWFGVMMVALVVVGAFAITFTNFMEDRLFGAKRIAFIFVLLAYAIYRIFRITQIRKQLRNEA
jgi:amino acid permease